MLKRHFILFYVAFPLAPIINYYDEIGTLIESTNVHVAIGLTETYVDTVLWEDPCQVLETTNCYSSPSRFLLNRQERIISRELQACRNLYSEAFRSLRPFDLKSTRNVRSAGIVTASRIAKLATTHILPHLYTQLAPIVNENFGKLDTRFKQNGDFIINNSDAYTKAAKDDFNICPIITGGANDGGRKEPLGMGKKLATRALSTLDREIAQLKNQVIKPGSETEKIILKNCIQTNLGRANCVDIIEQGAYQIDMITAEYATNHDVKVTFHVRFPAEYIPAKFYRFINQGIVTNTTRMSLQKTRLPKHAVSWDANVFEVVNYTTISNNNNEIAVIRLTIVQRNPCVEGILSRLDAQHCTVEEMPLPNELLITKGAVASLAIIPGDCEVCYRSPHGQQCSTDSTQVLRNTGTINCNKQLTLFDHLLRQDGYTHNSLTHLPSELITRPESSRNFKLSLSNLLMLTLLIIILIIVTLVNQCKQASPPVPIKNQPSYIRGSSLTIHEANIV